MSANISAISIVDRFLAVSYTHLRAHETVLDLVCRLLLEKKNTEKEQLSFGLTTHATRRDVTTLTQ